MLSTKYHQCLLCTCVMLMMTIMVGVTDDEPLRLGLAQWFFSNDWLTGIFRLNSLVSNLMSTWHCFPIYQQTSLLYTASSFCCFGCRVLLIAVYLCVSFVYALRRSVVSVRYRRQRHCLHRHMHLTWLLLLNLRKLLKMKMMLSCLAPEAMPVIADRLRARQFPCEWVSRWELVDFICLFT